MVSLLILCFSAFPLRTLETVVTEYPVRAAMDESVSFIDECYSGYNKVRNIIQNDKFNANVFAKKIAEGHFALIVQNASEHPNPFLSGGFCAKNCHRKSLDFMKNIKK